MEMKRVFNLLTSVVVSSLRQMYRQLTDGEKSQFEPCLTHFGAKPSISGVTILSWGGVRVTRQQVGENNTSWTENSCVGEERQGWLN